MWRWTCRAVQVLSILQVHQRDAATVGQHAVSLLVVGEAGVGGGMLLSQQGALTSTITQLTDRRLQAADLTVAAHTHTHTHRVNI